MALVTSISVIDINDMALFCYGTRCHLVLQIRCFWKQKIILMHYNSSVNIIHIHVLQYIHLFILPSCAFASFAIPCARTEQIHTSRHLNSSSSCSCVNFIHLAAIYIGCACWRVWCGQIISHSTVHTGIRYDYCQINLTFWNMALF